MMWEEHAEKYIIEKLHIEKTILARDYLYIYNYKPMYKTFTPLQSYNISNPKTQVLRCLHHAYMSYPHKTLASSCHPDIK